MSQDQIKRACFDTYSEESQETINVYIQELWEFVHTIQKGDYVVLPRLNGQKDIYVGVVLANYEYREVAPDVRHIRLVRWLPKISRSEFSPEVIELLGAPRTVYRLQKAAEDYIEKLLAKKAYITALSSGELNRQLMIAYGNVAKRVADKTLRCPHINFEKEIRVREEVRARFDAFIANPTEANLRKLWNKKCLGLAVGGDSIGFIKSKNTIDEIKRIFEQLIASNQYNPDWEALKAPWALRELWGKLNGQPVYYYENTLVSFGYGRSRTYQEFLDQFTQFAQFYQEVIGAEAATPYPIEIELDQLISFTTKATSCDLDGCDTKKQRLDIQDEDIQKLYGLKMQIDVKQIVDALAQDQRLADYVEARRMKTDQWDEAYKWDVLTRLHGEVFRSRFSEENVVEKVRVLQKYNPQKGTFVYWAELDDFLKLAESAPKLVAQSLNNLFAEKESLFTTINSFRDVCLKADGSKFGTPFFGYLFAAFDMNRYPLYKDSIFTSLKDNSQLAPVRLWDSYSNEMNKWGSLSIGMKYQRYCELCNEMGEYLETERLLHAANVGGVSVPAGIRALDGQDYLYFLSVGTTTDNTKSWIFQANPERFDLLGVLKPGAEIAWSVNQNRSDVTVGDKVYYWMSGPNAGIYGVGRVTAPPTKNLDTFGEWGVQTQVERVFLKNYVSKEKYVELPVLAESRIIRQPHMTNFRLSSDEAIAVEALIPRNELSELTGVPRHIQSILERKSQIILYGPPGTGKTYRAMTTALTLSSRSKFGVDFDSLSDEQKSLIQKGDSSCGALVRMCSFHPSYGYEEFLEGYRPHTKNDELTFELEDGMFKELSLDATKHPDDEFFLIIDEINRGDIPRIFGELLTILEKDKRGQEIVLPFSKERFSVPANAYVIGTMNTADRSIALLDTALRRRFGFIELMPDARILGDVVVEGIELAKLLDTLNNKILEHLGQTARDLQIGHSYLLKDGQPITDFVSLSRAVQEDIIPLLQEYCYENFTTLRKILGGALIDAKRQKINAEFFDPSEEERLIEALRAIVSEKIMPPVETHEEEESSDLLDENEGEE